MAALRTGAELLYLFTADEATTAIKSYSPDLMVAPVYGKDWGLADNQVGSLNIAFMLL
jgi:NAD(P)H-hydrate repair Nnr-like enzyme with NAD(P)H-hydrate dehydratase domain